MSIQNWINRIIRGSQFNSFNYDQDSLNNKEYPYAMVCLVVDENTMIAVGSDPLSPKDFMDKNKHNSFMVDLSIPPKTILTMQGQKTIYYAKLTETDKDEELELILDFVFHSSDHLRYENGRHVSGPHGGAPRTIKVESNISGNEGYTVTIFNTEAGQAVVQMTPKQMKLTFIDSEKIQLRGYGIDKTGTSFADYGLTIFHDDGYVEKCVLHMYDRGIDIEYWKPIEQPLEAEHSPKYGFEEITDFLNQFKTLPTNTKIELAGKTDQLNNIGVDYYERNDVHNAIIYYNKALEVYPINDDALKNLVVCYRESGNFEKMQEVQKKLDYLRQLGI